MMKHIIFFQNMVTWSANEFRVGSQPKSTWVFWHPSNFTNTNETIHLPPCQKKTSNLVVQSGDVHHIGNFRSNISKAPFYTLQFQDKGLFNRSSNPSMLFTFRYSQHSNLAPKSLQNRSPSRHGNCWGPHSQGSKANFRWLLWCVAPETSPPMSRNMTQQKSIQKLQMVINYTLLAHSQCWGLENHCGKTHPTRVSVLCNLICRIQIHNKSKHENLKCQITFTKVTKVNENEGTLLFAMSNILKAKAISRFDAPKDKYVPKAKPHSTYWFTGPRPTEIYIFRVVQ